VINFNTEECVFWDVVPWGFIKTEGSEKSVVFIFMAEETEEY
jgi:hypothetical protein